MVVDQFEELFRFSSGLGGREARDEAAAVVKLLVEAARHEGLSLYVVITMRSDLPAAGRDGGVVAGGPSGSLP